MFPDRHVRTDDGARADPRPVVDDRGRVHLRAVAARRGVCRFHAHQQLRFRDDRVVQVRDGLRAREAAPADAERDFEPQPIAGDDLPPELRVVHAAQPHALVPGRVRQQEGCDLRQRLDHQHPGHERRAGEVSLEEFFVDRDVLDRDEPASGLVFRHRVNERRRIAVAEPLQGGADIDRHGGSLTNWRVGELVNW